MTIDEFVEKFKEQYEKKNIVVFTGAGMSTQSGIPDFRGEKGLYKQNINAEEILSHHFFMQNSEEFYDFYRKNLLIDDSIKPNLAHELIKELEDKGYVNSIITQNIDGLDIKAGCKNVIELHGNASKFYCPSCHKSYSLDDIKNKSNVPRCTDCNSIIKPDVVLYEESLKMNDLIRAQSEIERAKTLLVIGSSLKVNPAASLVHDFIVSSRFDKDKKIFIVNKGETTYDGFMDIIKFDGDIIEVAKKLKKILK